MVGPPETKPTGASPLVPPNVHTPKALYWSAVVNGVLAAPLMAVMMMIAMNPRIMGRLTLPRPMLVIGWLATLVMTLATVGFFSN
jgi:Mn2+/Fe2+ NRAMP family transporter